MTDILFGLLSQVPAVSGEELIFLDYVNLGVLAVLVVAFIKEWIIPQRALSRALEELSKREEELKELRSKLDHEVLPQLWRTTELLAYFAKVKVNEEKEG